ncbi:uncharacterized protein BDR25DRAFT_210891 [Lindgomyces ingoldianus]|uniref:Uncharacterized protein n=1 Tax=Lindgomyces ingoldianus TaxID=673940 RepID=A0ACB6RBC5_9PLEO|nr:uncharacterized protein BDR25DRAFT_210891 [Lindgomyces ingoldianus]KAF2476441.1 hypothetical protein BDR25DRAFT_210891 [Lindgomyces ingoldianus]
MTFSGFSFTFWRFMEIITLIPALGMLAYFVHAYTALNSLTPNSILVLFIVSVLGAAWAVGTLFLYSRAKHSAGFVAFVDLLFVGAFIGGVYELRGISNADCTHFTRDSYFFNLGVLAITGNIYSPHVEKNCAMLKASFAFGIMNCIFFFLTFLLALLVHRHYGDRDRVVVKRETTHVSRHGHRSHRSRSPRHSHHSSRRDHYVV